MELQKASCVVTGAGRGLGEQLARELVARSAQVLLSDIERSEVQNVAAELGMQAMHCDVTDREQVENLARAAVAHAGGIDLWINNAGLWMQYLPAENTDFNKAHQLMEVNYFGLAYGMLEAIKHMRGKNAGIIANVLSVRALKGKALGASYSASKFAAEGFTQAVRDELADSGIAVVNVYPYRIKTGLFGEHKHEDYDTSMEPADVAKIIVENLSLENPPEHIEIWSPTDIRASLML